MQLPKPAPIQFRTSFSLVPVIILLLSQLSLDSSQFVYAFELDSRIPPDHNHPIRLGIGQNPNIAGRSIWRPYGEEIFHPSLHSRAPSGITALSNNDPRDRNIRAGQTHNWVFPKENIATTPGEVGPGLPYDNDAEEDQGAEGTQDELKRRQDTKTVYITLTTCTQPVANTSATGGEEDSSIPPQLRLWISQSSSLTTPGPGTTEDSDQQNIDFEGGYSIFEVNTTDDVYVGISAPNTTSWTGVWNYEIAASIDAPFHSLGGNSTSLYFVDGDNQAALLVTNDTTQTEPTSKTYKQWMAMEPPFGLFAHNQEDPTIFGVRNSFCGLKEQAQIRANIRSADSQNVATMVERGGLGGKPKEEFYIANLNASSTYYSFLVMEGNSTASGAGVVGGGGKVWDPVNFATKTEPNCALLYNLTFCSEVAYAVPSNPELFDPSSADGMSTLAAKYDSYASELYRAFNYSLQQIPCQAPPLQQYSLVRNCTDCARAYKTWLCAVTVPRCEDFSSNKPFLMPRNAGAAFLNGSSFFSNDDSNSNNASMLVSDDLPPFAKSWTSSPSTAATNVSRNPFIDAKIQPGPYKEVLPCQDLCYDLMQSCPSSLGFACPLPHRGLEMSYGRRGARDNRERGEVTCSYPGAVHFFSRASRSVVLPPAAFGALSSWSSGAWWYCLNLFACFAAFWAVPALLLGLC